MKTDACADFRESAPLEIFVDLGQTRSHRKRCTDGVERVLWLGNGRSKHGHDGVTDELVHDTVVQKHALDHPGEVLVQEVEQLPRIHVLADAGERTNVGKQHRDGDELTAERLIALHQMFSDLARDVSSKRFLESVTHLEALNHLVEVEGEGPESVAG